MAISFPSVSTSGSEPLGKFSTLLDSSTAYQHADSHRHDPIRRVLSMELVHFYCSVSSNRIRRTSTRLLHFRHKKSPECLGPSKDKTAKPLRTLCGMSGSFAERCSYHSTFWLFASDEACPQGRAPWPQQRADTLAGPKGLYTAPACAWPQYQSVGPASVANPLIT